MRSRGYEIRPAIDEDLPRIASLFREVEPHDPVSREQFMAVWRWLHDRELHRERPVLVGIADGLVVAHMGMAPFLFCAGGAQRRAALPCQLMVAASYRRTLLAPRLETQILSAYRNWDMEFAYALVTRPNVLEFHVALGFRAVGALRVYARPYRLGTVARELLGASGPARSVAAIASGLDVFRRASILPRNAAINVQRISQFDSSIDALGSCMDSDYHAMRTSTILNWRFVGVPGREYALLLASDDSDILGYAVLRRMPMRAFDVLAIVDIVSRPKRSDVSYALLRAIHEEAIRLRVDMTACLLSPQSSLRPPLMRAGYVATPEVFQLIVHDPDATLATASFGKWHVTWFDHDYV